MSTFEVLKRTSDHKRYYHPQSNTRREWRPSPNKQHPLQMYEFSKTAVTEQTTPASRAGKATRGYPNARTHRMRKKDGAIRGIAFLHYVTEHTTPASRAGKATRGCPNARTHRMRKKDGAIRGIAFLHYSGTTEPTQSFEISIPHCSR